MTALRERHVYATTDKNLRAIPMIGGHLIGTQVTGSNVPTPGSSLTITLSLTDDDEPAADYEMHVYADMIGGNQEADVIKTSDFSGNGTLTITGVSYPGGNRYYFLKIIQSNDDGEKDTVWTAPVWFEPTTAPPPCVTMLSLGVDLIREEATITNVGSSAVAIGGWSLLSVAGNQKFTFPPVFSLPPGGVVRVTSGPSALHQPPVLLRWTTEFRWRNSGDPGELRNSAGQLIASTP